MKTMSADMQMQPCPDGFSRNLELKAPAEECVVNVELRNGLYLAGVLMNVELLTFGLFMFHRLQTSRKRRLQGTSKRPKWDDYKFEWFALNCAAYGIWGLVWCGVRYARGYENSRIGSDLFATLGMTCCYGSFWYTISLFFKHFYSSMEKSVATGVSKTSEESVRRVRLGWRAYYFGASFQTISCFFMLLPQEHWDAVRVLYMSALGMQAAIAGLLLYALSTSLIQEVSEAVKMEVRMVQSEKELMKSSKFIASAGSNSSEVSNASSVSQQKQSRRASTTRVSFESFRSISFVRSRNKLEKTKRKLEFARAFLCTTAFVVAIVMFLLEHALPDDSTFDRMWSSNLITLFVPAPLLSTALFIFWTKGPSSSKTAPATSSDPSSSAKKKGSGSGSNDQ